MQLFLCVFQKMSRCHAVFPAEGINEGVDISETGGKRRISNGSVRSEECLAGVCEADTAQVFGEWFSGKFLKKAGKMTLGEKKLCGGAL